MWRLLLFDVLVDDFDRCAAMAVFCVSQPEVTMGVP
jgi:hypothetical protein